MNKRTDISIDWRADGSVRALVESALAESGYTIIHCSYRSPQKYIKGGWVNIWPTTYLEDRDTGDQLVMIHALNVPLAPHRHYFNSAGEMKRFSLIFPMLPKDWSYFSLIEATDDHHGFSVDNIMRNNTGVYHIDLC